MKKVVIIGGGIAGLSAGIYARKAGFETEIYEKNPVFGGQCMGWNRKGHHIDNCIHWLTGTKKGTGLWKLWEEIGALSVDSQFVNGDKFYTTYVGSESITLWKDLERTKVEMLALSQSDGEEIEKFITNVKYAMCCEMPVDKPMDMMNIVDYIKMGKLMKDMPKVMKTYGNMNLTDLANTFKHPVLKAMFTDYLPGEYTATSFIVSYATMIAGNGELPKGGSLAMTNRIIQRYKDLGGKLYGNSPVKKVNVKGKLASSITLENGREVTADYIISAVDTYELFKKILGKEYMGKEWLNCYDNEKDYPLFSGFQVAFSIDRECYDEKETIIWDCSPFYMNGREISRISAKSYEYESDFAPVSKTVLQCNVSQFDDDYRNWKNLSPDEYQTEKGKYAEILKNCIVEKNPSLNGHIELLDCWTPVTYEKYCNSYHGAYMSFITKKDIKSFRNSGVIDSISNVFIASQWLQAPGGLPVAAATGKFAVQRIMKKEKIKLQ